MAFLMNYEKEHITQLGSRWFVGVNGDGNILRVGG